MQTFLEKLVEYHVKNHLTEINDFCFVFPSRRAGLFFLKELTAQIDNPIWSPEIMPIHEFFRLLNPTPVSDNITLLFKLHTVYQEVMELAIGIDEFIPIGEMLLNDFNDIDNYLVSAEQLYSNLAAQKVLEGDHSYLSDEQVEAIRTFWNNFKPKKTSEELDIFLKVWDRLPQLYEAFRNSLSAEGLAYQGMISRWVAEKIKNERSLIVPYKRVVFAGFNALNNCEKRVFNQLNLQNKATFFWDYPQWILPEKRVSSIGLRNEHEAFRFLSYNLHQFPSPKDWEESFNHEFPEIIITSAANELVQAAIAHDFLQKLESDSSKDEKTGLILADEKQLLPVLHYIPEKFKAINITLGYPLKNTPAFALVDSLLAMQKTARQTKEDKENNTERKTWFYHRDVMALLRHQYINIILGEDGRKLVDKLMKANQVHILKNQFDKDELLSTIFTKVNGTAELAQYLNNILILVYEKLSQDEATKIEQEFIYFLYTAIKRLSDILSNFTQTPSPETWQMLFKKLAMQQSVPFKGEPLSGLQVMGILETRVLDFENLVVLGLNEGTFPKTNPPLSFIPYNLRKGFDLPTIDNQNSIFAYYFYRLIHRAKNIQLVYTTNQALTEESEMSRFLQQLVYEYPGKLKIKNIEQTVVAPKEPEIEATKNDKVMRKLNQWLTSDDQFLSPSALSLYLTCPMKFYYQQVVKIRESEEISEDLDPKTFGNLFHKTIEKLYSTFLDTDKKGREITEEDISKLRANTSQLKNIMREVFDETFGTDPSARTIFNDYQGKISLVFEIIFKYILQFLKKEELSAPFKLIGLEEKVRGKFQLDDERSVNIGGTVDRMQEQNGFLKIIDYKTGITDRRLTNVEQLFSQQEHDGKKAIFQTLLYALIKSKESSYPAIVPEVMSVRELHSNDYSSSITWNKATLTLHSVLESYESLLKETLIELFDPTIPFKQTENRKSCEYCTFKKHCLIN